MAFLLNSLLFPKFAIMVRNMYIENLTKPMVFSMLAALLQYRSLFFVKTFDTPIYFGFLLTAGGISQFLVEFVIGRQ